MKSEPTLAALFATPFAPGPGTLMTLLRKVRELLVAHGSSKRLT
jgi:hypothetical protein